MTIQENVISAISAWIVPESGPENGFTPIAEAAQEVDVTTRILGLPIEAFHKLRDDHGSTDVLVATEIHDFRYQHGQNAPFRVEVVNSILEFFDVDELDQVSADAFNVARNVEVEMLAKEFGEALKSHLSSDEMREVLSRNRAEADLRICHSHDFCDTNMVLHNVFVKHGIDIADEGGRDRWGILWHDVWNKAKSAEFWSS